MKSFKRILLYLLPYKFSAACNVIFNIFSVLFGLVSLAMIIPFLSLLFGKEQLVVTAPQAFSFSVSWFAQSFNFYLSKIIIDYGRETALAFICGIILFIFLLKNGFKYLATHYMATVRNGVVRDIRSQVFNKITQLPLSYFSEERKGDIIARLTNDVQEIEWGIMSVLEVTFREPMTVISYLVAMVLISPTLTLFVFVVLPITGIIIGRVGKSLRKDSQEAQHRLGTIMSLIDETLAGLRVVKAFNATEQQVQKFDVENNAYFDSMRHIFRKKEMSSPLSEFLSVAVIVLVLYVGGRMVLSHNLSLSAETFIGFMVIFSQMIQPAKQFANAFYNIQKGIVSVERITVILDTPISIKEIAQPIEIKDFKEKIEFKNVGFKYSEQQVLQNINIELKKGKTLALVGLSGAGKSTLADLLPRFYDVTEGDILIDGVNIKSFKINDLRNLIAIVTQEPILFNDTVFNNIAFGMPQNSVSIEEVVACAKIANAHNFIEQLPQGYYTNIGDRGNKLSGGERQRLTIARAVLKNAPILIMDEATSALDSASELLVKQALEQLMQHRTSLVIAHRLSTIQSADHIIVLEKGKIAEQGTHEFLIQQPKGIYSNLVKLQQL